MQKTPLGRTGLTVSAYTLGTMTWGSQTPQQDAFRQIDMALERGVTLLDTAEMYPTNPLLKKTQGDTERVIGNWLAQSGQRDRVQIATKVSGAGHMNVRDGAPISAVTIRQALEASLQSLKTDYVDLYQLHWPNRGSYMFRKNWTYDAKGQDREVFLSHVHEVLNCLDTLIAEGKIRAIGLSNESAWGTAQWLRIAEENSLPRMAAIQNEYSLLCRLFDTDLAELSHHEDIGLLAFSPLAAGLLAGRYGPDLIPEGTRRSVVSDLGGRVTR